MGIWACPDGPAAPSGAGYPLVVRAIFGDSRTAAWGFLRSLRPRGRRRRSSGPTRSTAAWTFSLSYSDRRKRKHEAIFLDALGRTGYGPACRFYPSRICGVTNPNRPVGFAFYIWNGSVHIFTKYFLPLMPE